jgi:hypothetical protein
MVHNKSFLLYEVIYINALYSLFIVASPINVLPSLHHTLYLLDGLCRVEMLLLAGNPRKILRCYNSQNIGQYRFKFQFIQHVLVPYSMYFAARLMNFILVSVIVGMFLALIIQHSLPWRKS